MKKMKYLFLLCFAISLISCDLVNLVPVSNPLTEAEVANGLKAALTAGADTAARVLNKQDGYLKDAAIKVLLPPEAKIITDNITSVPGGTVLVDNVLTSMNRAAEDAASEAKPIFVDAVTSMSISDAFSILNGKNPLQKSNTFDSTAATSYLKIKTTSALVAAFAPKIDNSLNKKLLGDFSTNSLWSNLTSAYNLIAPFIGLSQVNSSLGGYVTDKALQGLFYRVGLEEKKIRKNPVKWAVDIIQRVFGSVAGA